MRTSLVSVVAASALVFVLQQPEQAHAGPVEQLVQLSLHPSDPDVMVLRYIYGGDGVFFTRDGGATWHMACLSAISASINRSGPTHITDDGHTLMGVFEGLYEDDGNGCNWQPQMAAGGKWVSDIAQDPTDPAVTYVTTSSGGEGIVNGIVRRNADGSYEPFGSVDEMLISRLRVAATENGLRFYESAIKGMINVTVDGMETAVPNYLVRVSDDGAETFREFPFTATEGSFRMLAVDPQNEDRLVALIERDMEPDQVLVSEDQGETFTPYMEVSQFGAIAFAPDGRLWIGEAGVSTNPNASVGLWSAANLDTSPEKIGDYPVQCLGYQPDTDKLYACQRWWFGTVDTTSGEFTEMMRLTSVDSFVSCGDMDMAAACEAQLCRDYCGPAHFAQAPVCTAYTSRFCGVCVAADETDASVPACEAPPPSAGAGAGAGSGASAGTGGQSGSPPDAGVAGSGAGASGSGDDDGGGCSYAGGTRRGAGHAALGAVLFVLGCALQRRKRRV